MELEGSSLLEDVAQSRSALYDSYQKLFPSLSNRFPSVFPEVCPVHAAIHPPSSPHPPLPARRPAHHVR